jgi:hypothetical protein
MTVHDPRADGRRARRLFSTGLMSDTKWRKLFEAIAEACDPTPDHVVVKFIDVDEPERMRFPFGFHPPRPYIDTLEHGPTELRAIEWLDVPGDIVGLLEPVGRFPVERQGAYTRVTGYTGPR